MKEHIIYYFTRFTFVTKVTALIIIIPKPSKDKVFNDTWKCSVIFVDV